MSCTFAHDGNLSLISWHLRPFEAELSALRSVKVVFQSPESVDFEASDQINNRPATAERRGKHSHTERLFKETLTFEPTMYIKLTTSVSLSLSLLYTIFDVLNPPNWQSISFRS